MFLEAILFTILVAILGRVAYWAEGQLPNTIFWRSTIHSGFTFVGFLFGMLLFLGGR